MTETLAGFGMAEWLPQRIQRQMMVQDAAEAAEAKRAEAERATAADDRLGRALELYRSGAEARGEVVSAVALATGEGLGRSIGDVLSGLAAAADRQDGREAAQRRARGEREPVEIFYGEPQIARTVKPLTRKQIYVKRPVDKFRQAHPDADVIDRAMFTAAASKTWRP